jgi:hypothetical protein
MCHDLQPIIVFGVYFGLSIIVTLLFKYDIICYENGTIFFFIFSVSFIVFLVVIYFKNLLCSKAFGSEILSNFCF